MKNRFEKKSKKNKRNRFWRVGTWTMILSTVIGLVGLAERILVLTDAKKQVEQDDFLALLKEERNHVL